MRSKKRGQPFIRKILKTEEGGAHIYVLCMSILVCMIIFYLVLFDYKRTQITADIVDDALTTSLVSACVYNQEEKALSGSQVMYRTLSEAEDDFLESLMPGMGLGGDGSPADPEEKLIDHPDLYNAHGDSFLDKSYNYFVKNLKKNLKLDDTMVATISGIEGEVVIQEFTIYNKFCEYDEHGNLTEFRFMGYRRTGDSWYVIPYAANILPTCYNSLDKSTYQITETSVYAALEFDLVASRFDGVGLNKVNGVKPRIWYARVVDITDN